MLASKLHQPTFFAGRHSLVKVLTKELQMKVGGGTASCKAPWRDILIRLFAWPSSFPPPSDERAATAQSQYEHEASLRRKRHSEIVK